MTSCIAAIQMTSHHNIQENLKQAATFIKQATDYGAHIVVLPEMFAIMGLDQMDKVNCKEKLGSGIIQDFLRNQAIENNIWIVGGTIPIEVPEAQEKVHAACLLYDNYGKVVARYDKIHLFDVAISSTQEHYFESKSTYPGRDVVVADTPFGKIGLAVCYDIRFPELFRAMHAKGVEIIALPSAFTFTTGIAHWDILVRARAIENQVYMVAAAQTGVHNNKRKTFGHSMIVDPWGNVNSSLQLEEGCIVSEINLEFLHKIRSEFPALAHRKI